MGEAGPRLQLQPPSPAMQQPPSPPATRREPGARPRRLAGLPTYFLVREGARRGHYWRCLAIYSQELTLFSVLAVCFRRSRGPDAPLPFDRLVWSPLSRPVHADMPCYGYVYENNRCAHARARARARAARRTRDTYTVKRRIIKYKVRLAVPQRSLKPRARYLLLLLLQTQEVASLRG